MNANNAVHHLLLADALHDILVAERHGDGVATRRNLVRLDGDGREESRQTVPLSCELVTALGERDGVLEGGRRLPER